MTSEATTSASEHGDEAVGRHTTLMPFRILVVTGESESRAAIERVLARTNHLVTYLSRFEEAKQRVEFAPPDLLITEVKLGAYNGLHLVLRAHSDRPHMAAIVLHPDADPVLAAEA